MTQPTPAAHGSAHARMHAAGLSSVSALWLVAGLLMLQPLATDLYLPALPTIARHFGASAAAVQWTLSIFVAAFGAWQLVAGPLADRWGRLPIVLGGAAIFCIGSAVCALAPTLAVLVAGRALQAVGACSCLVCARAITRDLYTPAEGARLLASASTVMALAPLAGPLLGAQLTLAFGWRATFVALALFAALLLAVAAWRLRETNPEPNPHALRIAPMLRGYGQILRSRTFRAYAATSAASYAGLFAFLAGSPFVLIQGFGLSPTRFGLALAVTVAGYMTGTFACRRLVVARGLPFTVQAGALLQLAAGATLAAGALAGVHHPLALIVPMCFFGASHGLIQPPALAGAVAPFRTQAGAAAALTGFLMMAVATPVGLWMGVSFHGTATPLALTLGATSTVTAWVALRLVRRDGHVHVPG